VQRATLIVNPYSSAVDERRIAAVEEALGTGVELTTQLTRRPGHATELAAAAAGSADAVIVLGGDGTYNEAVNGLDGQTPVGFLPGGGTSVLPRALGLPRDAVGAARAVAAALAAGRTRRIGLGRVNGRRFAFSAGVGLDAEVVRRIDTRGRTDAGKRPGDFAFAAAVIGRFAEAHLRFDPVLEIEGVGRAAFLLVANGSPYTFAGPVPLRLVEGGRFEGGLGYAAPSTIRPAILPRLMARALRGRLGDDPLVHAGSDVDRIAIRADRPLPLQVDGEDLGDVEEAVFEAERDALAVLV
jgi:diacylglycerol kinase family enzyme